MKKFERINSYNKKYTNELSEALKIIMPWLIEAFVRIFGEKHRQYITYTLTHLKFVFFIPKAYAEVLLKDSYGIRKKDLAIIAYYLKYRKYLDLKLKSFPKKDQDDFRLESYTTRLDIDDGLEYQTVFALKDDCALMFTAISELEEEYFKDEIVVQLPILTIDLKTIIHELTHSLIDRAVLCTDDEIITPSLFLNDEASELMNDYIASQTLEEYKNLGGPIPKCLRRIEFGNAYEDKDILVSYFYDSLAPLILESAITGNHNKLWKLAGASFSKYCAEVKRIFNSKEDVTQDKYDVICHYVDEMEDHVLGVQETDYEGFYQELESMGYRVRRL